MPLTILKSMTIDFENRTYLCKYSLHFSKNKQNSFDLAENLPESIQYLNYLPPFYEKTILSSFNLEQFSINLSEHSSNFTRYLSHFNHYSTTFPQNSLKVNYCSNNVQQYPKNFVLIQKNFPIHPYKFVESPAESGGSQSGKRVIVNKKRSTIMSRKRKESSGDLDTARGFARQPYKPDNIGGREAESRLDRRDSAV